MSQDKHNPLFNEIDHILAELAEQSARKHNTVPLLGPDEQVNGPVRVVSVDTYESPDGQTSIAAQEVQAPNAQPTAAIDEQEAAEQRTIDHEPTPAYRRGHRHDWPIQFRALRRHHQRVRPHLLILFAVFAVCLGVFAYLFVMDILPMFQPSVTVTIIPISRQIDTSDTMTITTTTASVLAPHQLAGRVLSSVTMTQAQSTETTGKGHQGEQAGHGYVTFYNSATYAQTVDVGTLLTGADGVQIVTDTDATIPAAVYPTFGQASVSAHAVTTGPAGNIRAADIYGPCCRLNISAVNGAFSGGQNARDFQAVSQHDIDNTASSLKSSLDQSVQAALQTQVHGDESLLPLPCQQLITADHQAGEEATQVRITASETCTGIAYNAARLHDLVMQQQNQQAATQLGQGYALTGSIQTSVQHVTTKNSTITLQVKSSGIWAYQFSQAQQEHLKALIVGQSKAQAISTLLHVAGVQTVSIDADTLPSSPKGINLEFLQTL